jgi:hypothetical protein
MRGVGADCRDRFDHGGHKVVTGLPVCGVHESRFSLLLSPFAPVLERTSEGRCQPPNSSSPGDPFSTNSIGI